MDVAVLGAGQRGRDVTRECVRAGVAVSLWADDVNAVMDCIDALDRELDDGAVTAMVDGTTGLESAVDSVDLVVDATDRDAESRRDLLADLESAIGAETLVATGDETTSVTVVATGLRAPDRALGLNLIDPPAVTTVEVVRADQTSDATLDRATAFVETLGATPLVVRDTPGFAATRLELASIVEAIRMLEAGIASAPDIDRAAGDDDRPGPLARADRRGLDTVLAGLEDLTNRLDGRFDPPGLLRERVADGALGVSTGEGFYVWEGGEPVRAADHDVTGTPPPEEFSAE